MSLSNMQGTTVSSSYAGFVDDTPPVLKAVFIQRIAKFACKTVERTIELAHVHTAWLDTMSNLRQAENIFKHNIPVDIKGFKKKNNYYSSKQTPATEGQANWEKVKKLFLRSCETGSNFWVAQALLDSRIGFVEEKEGASTEEEPRTKASKSNYKPHHATKKPSAPAYHEIPLLQVDWEHDYPKPLKLIKFPSCVPNSSMKDCGSRYNYQSVGHRAMRLAIEHNRIDIVSLLLEQEIFGNKEKKGYKTILDLYNSSYKQSPLHVAAYYGRAEIVELLLDHAGKKNRKDLVDLLFNEDESGRQAIHWAVDSPEIVRILYEKALAAFEQPGGTGTEKEKYDLALSDSKTKAKPSQYSSDRTSQKHVQIMHLACAVGNLETVKLLRSDLVNVDIMTVTTPGNISTLHVASAVNPDNNNKHKKHHNAKSSSSSSSSSATAAASGGGGGGSGDQKEEEKDQINAPFEIVKFLIQQASEEIEKEQKENPEILLLAFIDKKVKGGKRALHFAAKTGNFELAKLLLEKGASRHAPDDQGNTPLHDCGDSAEMIALLLLQEEKEKSAAVEGDEKNVVPSINAVNRAGETPLHRAAHHGHMKALKELIKLGASVDPLDNKHETPLFQAVKFHNPDSVKALLEVKANPKIPCKGEEKLNAYSLARQNAFEKMEHHPATSLRVFALMNEGRE